MREPIPFINGPGAIIVVGIVIISYFAGFDLGTTSDKTGLIVVIIAALVVISPLFNVIFHAFWLLTKNYANIGYQRLMQVKEPSMLSHEIMQKFDKEFYSKALPQSVDYARRRTHGYLINLHCEVATLIILASVMGFDFFAKNATTTNFPWYVYIVFGLLVFVFHTAKEIINRDLTVFEKNIYEGKPQKSP